MIAHGYNDLVDHHEHFPWLTQPMWVDCQLTIARESSISLNFIAAKGECRGRITLQILDPWNWVDVDDWLSEVVFDSSPMSPMYLLDALGWLTLAGAQIKNWSVEMPRRTRLVM